MLSDVVSLAMNTRRTWEMSTFWRLTGMACRYWHLT